MHLSQVQTISILADLVLTITIAVIYRRGTLRYTWKTISDLCIVRATITGLALCLIFGAQHLSQHLFDRLYFLNYYAAYIVSTALTLKLYYEVYLRATLPFEGFAKWGKSLFAWVIFVMIIMTLMTIGTANAAMDFYARAGINMMRAVGTVNLCVAAFLCYLIRSMGLPLRSKVFGLMFGLVLGDLGDILLALQMQLHMQASLFLTYVVQYSGIITAGIWIAYAYIPEPAPRPVTLPADSPVYRWSQIAMALGNKGAQVALPEPQHSFFLTDVEKVVDRVFARNLASTESER